MTGKDVTTVMSLLIFKVRERIFEVVRELGEPEFAQEEARMDKEMP